MGNNDAIMNVHAFAHWSYALNILTNYEFKYLLKLVF